jgi:hypothetical protein
VPGNSSGVLKTTSAKKMGGGLIGLVYNKREEKGRVVG